MTSPDDIPTVQFHMPEDPAELRDLLSDAYHRGLAVADDTTPAQRWQSGYLSGAMDCVERLVECYGLSAMHATHSRPDTEEGQDNAAFHGAQAGAYHTAALTMMVHEMGAEPETAIVQFERLLFAASLKRFPTGDGEFTMLFPYTPTSLCEGFIGGYNASGDKGAEPDAPVPPATHPSDCGCGGTKTHDTLVAKPGTDVLAFLQASYDRIQAANASDDEPEAPYVMATDFPPAEPLDETFDPSQN